MKTKSITSKIKNYKYLLILFCFFNTALYAQNWTQIASGTNKKINTICFSSSTIGYLGGNDSLLMKTTNGGATWSNVSYTGITFYTGGEHIINMQFLNDNVGFVVTGPYGGVYGTTDGALTWNMINIATNQCFNQGLFFFDESNGFIGGSGCFQGELMSAVVNQNWATGTWNQVVLSAGGFLADNYITDINFYTTNFGMAVSRSGYVYRTTNGGLIWDSVSTPLPLNKLTSVLIINDTLAYAGYETTNSGFGLYISTDAGLTWGFDGNSATFYYPNFYALNQSGNGTVYAAGLATTGSTGIIFSSPTIGNWSYDVLDQKINGIDSYNDSIVFAVGDSGYIVVNHPGLLTGVKNKGHNNNEEISLYPNPTSSIINIKLNTQSNLEQLNFTIYSGIGEAVKTGVMQSSIDISDLNVGMYFIEVNGENTHLQKKIIKE